ncbi:hypothetical protein, partial [Streptomyces nigra]
MPEEVAPTHANTAGPEPSRRGRPHASPEKPYRVAYPIPAAFGQLWAAGQAGGRFGGLGGVAGLA